MSDRLEALLAETGRSIEWPAERDLVAAVGARIETRRPRPWLLPRIAFAVASLVLLAAGILVFSPAARTAVADFLGIGGVRITYGPTPTAEPDPFDLGEIVDLDAARAEVSFPLATIEDPVLGEPDRVYLDRATPAGPMVSFVYEERPGLDVDEETGVGLVLTQFEANLARQGDFLKKLAVEGTDVTAVEVDGASGYWLEGDPHFFYYERDGMVTEEAVRLVGNVLLWQRGEVTVRLEVGDLSLNRALELARTVR